MVRNNCRSWAPTAFRVGQVCSAAWLRCFLRRRGARRETSRPFSLLCSCPYTTPSTAFSSSVALASSPTSRRAALVVRSRDNRRRWGGHACRTARWREDCRPDRIGSSLGSPLPARPCAWCSVEAAWRSCSLRTLLLLPRHWAQPVLFKRAWGHSRYLRNAQLTEVCVFSFSPKRRYRVFHLVCRDVHVFVYIDWYCNGLCLLQFGIGCRGNEIKTTAMGKADPVKTPMFTH